MLIRKEAPPDIPEPKIDMEFESDPSMKNRVLDTVLDELKRSNAIGPEDMFWCRLVVDEALVNAIKHGNGYDKNKKVVVKLSISPDEWILYVEDEGNGFRKEDIPSPEDEESLLLDHGRGINLIKFYMDSLTYYKGGRILFTCKKRGD